jgi:hypothetical protein
MNIFSEGLLTIIILAMFLLIDSNLDIETRENVCLFIMIGLFATILFQILGFYALGVCKLYYYLKEKCNEEEEETN